MIVKLQNVMGKDLKIQPRGEKKPHIIKKGWQTDSNSDNTSLERERNF